MPQSYYSRAVRTAATLVIIAVLGGGTSFATGQHQMFTPVLSEHVQSGSVDYPALCKDSRFDDYLAQLENTDPDQLAGRDERLAFWINAYNAFTLELICDHYPVDSINEIHTGGLILASILNRTAWDINFITINGNSYTLNKIEHDILRKDFDEPRIHFAIVCAAKSCPPLRSEAYEGDALEQQLNDQGRTFLTTSAWNTFDADAKKADISAIFKWFRKDFADNNSELLDYLAQFLPEGTAEAIRQDPGAWRVTFKKYNWALNGQTS